MLSLVLSIVVERLEGRGQPLRKTAGWASYDSGEEDSDGDQAGPALLDAGLASLSLLQLALETRPARQLYS